MAEHGGDVIEGKVATGIVLTRATVSLPIEDL